MERNSFIFYKSFYEASKYLSNEEKGKLFDMICQYGLYGNDIEGEGASMGMFLLIKPQLDANNKRYENGCKGGEYGKLGGRPKKNWENSQKPQNNPNQTPNDNVNDNVNENEKEIITNSSTEQSSENQKENNSLSLDNSNIEEKEKSSAKKEKEEIHNEINDLINQIKNVCNELGVAYNKDMERQFAKHILTAKEYGEFCEKIGQGRVQFAINVLKVSVAIGYFRGALSGPKSIYKNYAELYNQAKQKAPKIQTPTINVL